MGIQHSVFSSRPNQTESKMVDENCMVSRHSFVKADPSLPLRISLGGSDAARTAQDVLFRD